MPDATTTVPPQPSGSDHLDRARLRLSLLMLGGVSIGSTALIISMTVTALVAESITGDATWSGLPVAASVMGTAVGTSALSAAMTRWGARFCLAGFYAIAAFGGVVACLATIMGSLPLLIAAVFVVGLGNSANALTRYVAAELQTPARRATMVGWIVWSGTVGAVIGPNLLSPSDRAGVWLGLAPLSGTYLVSALTFFSAAALYVLWLRPDPKTLRVVTDGDATGVNVRPTGVGRLFRHLRVQISVVALVFGHMVMVLIMTMTPLHLQAAGHSLYVIGLVASSHIVGMFLFAPVAGFLVDRVGALPMILVGHALLLVASVGGMTVLPSNPVLIGGTLFLLGLGWNFGFVAGSANLTREIPIADRGPLQGRTDSMVWMAAAVASFSSSLLYSTVGFAGLCAVGAVGILISLSMIAVRRRSVPEPARAI